MIINVKLILYLYVGLLIVFYETHSTKVNVNVNSSEVIMNTNLIIEDNKICFQNGQISNSIYIDDFEYIVNENQFCLHKSNLFKIRHVYKEVKRLIEANFKTERNGVVNLSIYFLEDSNTDNDIENLLNHIIN